MFLALCVLPIALLAGWAAGCASSYVWIRKGVNSANFKVLMVAQRFSRAARNQSIMVTDKRFRALAAKNATAKLATELMTSMAYLQMVGDNRDISASFTKAATIVDMLQEYHGWRFSISSRKITRPGMDNPVNSWSVHATGPDGGEYATVADCFPSAIAKFCRDTGMDELTNGLNRAMKALQAADESSEA
jgi:hypothetical protein